VVGYLRKTLVLLVLVALGPQEQLSLLTEKAQDTLAFMLTVEVVVVQEQLRLYLQVFLQELVAVEMTLQLILLRA
jgi:hypothetical protein